MSNNSDRITEFQRVIEECGLSDNSIARMYGISIEIASRWRNGTNSPHPTMGEHVTSELQTVSLLLENLGDCLIGCGLMLMGHSTMVKQLNNVLDE